MTASLSCPLCRTAQSRLFARDKQRDYYCCDACQLVFVPPAFHLSPAAEKQRYDTHQNVATDPGYRDYLNRLAQPLLSLLPQPSHGLDYGSGPDSALIPLLEAQRHQMAIYDVYYANDPAVLEQRYDFVTCSEAIEHFNRPAQAWRQLWSLVRPGGWLAIMTQLRDEVDDFIGWYYKNDPTHIAFYSRPTFTWLAQRDGLQAHFYDHSVVLLQRCD